MIRPGPNALLPALKKPRAKSRDLEHQEQSLLFQWAEHSTGRYPELALLFAIPNFAGRLGTATARHGARLKKEGRKPGVPDICLPIARGRFHALYIELKAPEGVATKEQLTWLSALLGAGNAADLCYGWEAAAERIQSYLSLGRYMAPPR